MDSTQRNRLYDSVRPLRLYRVARGWRQVDLAEAAGIRAESVCRIETGRVQPHAATAAALARALQVPVAELFPESVRNGSG